MPEPENEPLIPKHGGYRKLISFQVAELAYDVTVRFCDKYIDRRSRTHDQMVQAARSGARNISEGSQVSGTSKELELKLTNVARSSLEELSRDYMAFLRHRRLTQWEPYDPRLADLIARRPGTEEDFARWAEDVKNGLNGRNGQNGQETRDPSSFKSIQSIPSIPRKAPTYREIAANGALALIVVATSLLDRQLAAQAEAFRREGGFTERLYRHRRQSRDQAKGT